MNEKNIIKIGEVEFGRAPVQIIRKTIGICNEVYEMVYESDSYILRMNQVKEFLYGTHKFLPLFRKMRIKTPSIIAEDYSKTTFPFCYQIQSKIEGDDLGVVIDKLSHEELRGIAREVSGIFDKFNALPATEGFGGLTGLKEDNYASFWEVQENHRKNVLERNAIATVLDKETMELYDDLLADCKSYFEQVDSKLFYDDMNAKNVMIHLGKFNGLVDLDFLSKGDYLSALGSMITCWHGEEFGEIYINEIIKLQKLDSFQRKMTKVYAIFHMIGWTSEAAVRFNGNTTAGINWSNVERNRKKVKAIYDSIE